MNWVMEPPAAHFIFNFRYLAGLIYFIPIRFIFLKCFLFWKSICAFIVGRVNHFCIDALLLLSVCLCLLHNLFSNCLVFSQVFISPVLPIVCPPPPPPPLYFTVPCCSSQLTVFVLLFIVSSSLLSFGLLS